MVGATRLAALAERLESAIRANDGAATAALLAAIAECGELTSAALRAEAGEA
jgi:HPt (histidine-containing phosphotransfer) domain-containing protein